MIQGQRWRMRRGGVNNNVVNKTGPCGVIRDNQICIENYSGDKLKLLWYRQSVPAGLFRPQDSGIESSSIVPSNCAAAIDRLPKNKNPFSQRYLLASRFRPGTKYCTFPSANNFGKNGLTKFAQENAENFALFTNAGNQPAIKILPSHFKSFKGQACSFISGSGESSFQGQITSLACDHKTGGSQRKKTK